MISWDSPSVDEGIVSGEGDLLAAPEIILPLDIQRFKVSDAFMNTADKARCTPGFVRIYPLSKRVLVRELNYVLVRWSVDVRKMRRTKFNRQPRRRQALFPSSTIRGSMHQIKNYCETERLLFCFLVGHNALLLS